MAVAALAPPGGATASTPPALTLTAGGTVGATVTGGDQLTWIGDTSVSVAVSRTGGGNATVVGGPDSSLPTAIQFPPFVPSGTGNPPAPSRATPGR